MSTTTSERLNRIKNWTPILPVFVRRVHRIVGAMWVLSLALAYAVSTTGGEVPGPSLPGLSIITLVITGGYLLLRPWVRGPITVWDRLKGLKHWNWTTSFVIRRTHRIASALWLLFLAIGLLTGAEGGPEESPIIIPIVVFIVYLTVTGIYMLLRPWVNRFRAG